MQVPYSTRSPYDAAIEFFVVREKLTFLDAREDTTDTVYFKTDGLYVCKPGTEDRKLAFQRNKNNFIQNRPCEFQPPLWRRAIIKHNTYLTIDVFLNVRELECLVKSGIRFGGRGLLYQCMMSLGYQNSRITNCIIRRHIPSQIANELMLSFQESNARSSKVETPVGLLTPLYIFQQQALSKMIRLESVGVSFTEISSAFKLIASEEHAVWMTKKDTYHIGKECERVEVSFNGGFLTDKMGMGKTLTMLALCKSNPIKECQELKRPISTLVICPSHVISHWVREITKHTDMTHISITVKDQMEKTNVSMIMSGVYDFVLVSFNVFCNPSFKRQMDYYSCSVHHKTTSFLSDFERQSVSEQSNQNFVPHVYHWGRIIIDEFHELSNASYTNLGSYISTLKGDAKWLISGTPLVHPDLFRQIVPSFMFRGNVSDADVPIHDVMMRAIMESNVFSSNYDIQIPDISESVIKIELSQSERTIYESLRTEGRDQQLRVCSYARLAKVLQDSSQEVATLDEMKRVVRNHLVTKLENVKNGIQEIDFKEHLLLDLLRRTGEAYNLRGVRLQKDALYTQKEEMLSTLKYIDHAEEKECIICLDAMEMPCTIRHCGHRMCNECLTKAMKVKPACPICRHSYTLQDVIKLAPSSQENEVLRRYGSKLYHLLEYLKSTSSVKTLIFSQWDELLKDVGKCIITVLGYKRVSYCRGNIMQRRSSIELFMNSPADNLLLLSTLNSGSGCDLSIAKRVILLDTIDGSGAFITGIERQAIGRCHRIGQNDTVHVVRFIVKDSIEEEIYESVMSM